MQAHLTFNVTPRLPEPLEPLRELAFNLWWSWEPDARSLFRHLDERLWHATNHAPVRMLQMVSQARLEELATDDDFLHELGRVERKFRAYMGRDDTFARVRAREHGATGTIAYFSAEFGFHESVPIYSGGLGILAGDHCKSASDLGLDFTAVTLLYRHGYFKQRIDRDGRQEEVSLNQNFHHLPIEEVTRDGDVVKVSVEMPGRPVLLKVWRMQVGRITLYLLDADLAENDPADREITARLYGGDKEMRIRQELLLGVGGVRALTAVGVQPRVFHMNEGHSAFLSIERIRCLMEREQLEFPAALQVVAASQVFTTHTPVPAGNDTFPRPLVESYLGHFAETLRIPFDQLYAHGLSTSAAPTDDFGMTVLALRTSRHANAVSRLHGAVSRAMWKDVWKGTPVEEVPITSVTNGVHTKTWLAPEFSALYDRHLAPDWEEYLTEPEFWRRVFEIPATELWETHHKLKQRLVSFVRRRIVAQRQRNNETPEMLRKVNSLLDPEVLTVGFARRFATYKRAVLLFADPARLDALVNNPERPVQFLFAGKAHPADEEGKRFIQKVVEFSRLPEFENRIAFIEDYDAYIGRRLYQGVDLWLNNPLRPLEASGTSGMKLPPNGGLNLSVLDGWWLEAYNGDNGWPIGGDIENGPAEFQNAVDSASLYSTLENQIVPLFYAKPDGRLPLAWIQLMRESIRSITPVFNTHRMVKEYNERLYEPASRAHSVLGSKGGANARKLSEWKAHMRGLWDRIRIVSSEIDVEDRFHVPFGEPVLVRATVHLNGLDPADVRVQMCGGLCDSSEIEHPNILDMDFQGPAETKGDFLYTGRFSSPDSGSYGLTVRVIPHSPLMTQPHELRLVRWAE